MAARKGLRTPAVTGMGHREELELKEKWNSHDRAMQWLWDKGIAVSVEPNCECPRVHKSELTSGSPVVYAELFTKLLAWHQYIGEQYALVKAKKLDAEDAMERLAAKKRKELRDLTKKPSVEAMKDEVLTDPLHEELGIIVRDHTTLKDILEIELDNIERRLRAVSRQIEFHKIEFESGRRETNLNRPSRTRVPVRPK